MVGLRKVIRVVHRDAGYFFVGMTIIYAVSGIFLNHIRDWNSNYEIQVEPVSLVWTKGDAVEEADARRLLSQVGEAESLKSYYLPTPGKLKIFFEGGSLEMDTSTGSATLERLEKRPVLFELNFLHYNPGTLWKCFSDVFCVSLVIIAVTGLFILKGKKGIKGRGAWLAGAGVIVPAIFLLLYL